MKVSESVSAPGRAGLAYFGTLGASFCHEMRNVVAVLNENCGLLTDFLRAGSRGRDIEPARVERVNERVARFVTRADDLLTRFSRLAHATDHDYGEADLDEMVTDVVALGARIVASTGEPVRVSSPGGITVHTSPFFARLLLWRCVAATLQSPGKAEPTTVTLVTTPSGAEACITPAGGAESWSHHGFPGSVDRELCTLARCAMTMVDETGELVIRWPRDPRRDHEGEQA